MSTPLDSFHLADLHSLAGKAGIERFRLLDRGELIEAIRDSGVDIPDAPKPEPARKAGPAPRRQRQRRPAGERGERSRGGRGSIRREAGPTADAKVERPATTATESDSGAVAGELQVTRRGHGFIVPEAEGEADDVYVSASQIRRCSLRSGDRVAGPWRGPRSGERHRALTRVEEVNGEPIVAGPGTGFEDLTAVAPHRRLELSIAEEDVVLRAADRLAPLAYGQRVLVVAEPHSGHVELLRSIARAAAASEGSPDPLVLLIDERPEEVTAWRSEAPQVEIEATTADEPSSEHRLRAERVLGRVRRRVERGEDALLVVDSLSRLAASADLDTVKALFGSGRETAEEGAGSLTVIAAVAIGTGSDLADRTHAALATTETASIVIDADLAAAGVVPPLDIRRTRAVGDDEEAAKLRGELADLEPRAAAERLAELL